MAGMTTWRTRISDLQASGLTYAQIATLTGMAPSTIGDLATGRTKAPRGNAALTLDKLHRTSKTKAAKAKNKEH